MQSSAKLIKCDTLAQRDALKQRLQSNNATISYAEVHMYESKYVTKVTADCNGTYIKFTIESANFRSVMLSLAAHFGNKDLFNYKVPNDFDIVYHFEMASDDKFNQNFIGHLISEVLMAKHIIIVPHIDNYRDVLYSQVLPQNVRRFMPSMSCLRSGLSLSKSAPSAGDEA